VPKSPVLRAALGGAALLVAGILVVRGMDRSARGVVPARAPASATAPEKTEAAKPPAKAPRPRPAVTPQPASSAASEDEAALMERLRAAQDTDPALALTLAREGNEQYPDSPEVPERAALAIKSLALLGRFAEARGEAEKMVNAYPDSRWATEVERHTGAHRRPLR
jgi:hypothetical protein